MAVACSVDLPAESSLWDAGIAACRPVFVGGRDERHYAPEVDPGPGATPMERFLCLVGRRPRQGELG